MENTFLDVRKNLKLGLFLVQLILLSATSELFIKEQAIKLMVISLLKGSCKMLWNSL